MTAVIFNFPDMVKQLDNPPNRIREWRLKRSMKQWELADAIGVKQNAISRIEAGAREVSIYRFRQIAQALKVDIGQLLAPDDNRMGLDEEGAALVRQLQDRPDLAPALAHVAQTMSRYDAGPPTIEPIATVTRMEDHKRG